MSTPYQVLPRYPVVSIYRLDANIRHSTVIGIVGAGGIGILLHSSISQFLWQEVAVMLLAVFGVIVLSEFISATVPQRIKYSAHPSNVHLSGVTPEPVKAFTTEDAEVTEETRNSFPHLTFPIRERDFIEICC